MLQGLDEELIEEYRVLIEHAINELVSDITERAEEENSNDTMAV